MVRALNHNTKILAMMILHIDSFLIAERESLCDCLLYPYKPDTDENIYETDMDDCDVLFV